MRRFKLGRRRPVLGPRFSFRNYMSGPIHVPQGGNYAPAAEASLSNVYLNDTLGDCVIAGMAHIEGVLSGNAGAEVLYTDQQITAAYSAIGGYVPGDPSTDDGCDEVTALNHWLNKGFLNGAHKIAGWMTVDATNPYEYKAAMYLFENLLFGVDLPDEWITPMPSESGFFWDDVGPADPNNGHAFVGVGWGKTGVVIDSWGMTGYITDSAIQKYAGYADGGNLYTVLSADGIARASARAPNGFDFAQLLADFKKMGGRA
jgi:hypothetical protein